MKYRSYKKLMAIVTALTLSLSMIACQGAAKDQQTEQQTEEPDGKEAEEQKEETEQQEEPEQKEESENAGELEEITVGADMETSSTVNGLDDGLCSWTTGGTEAGTLNGDDYSFTPAIYIHEGTYDKEKSAVGDAKAVTDTETKNIKLTIEKEAVNGIMVNNSTYSIADSVINVATPDADGSLTCDFSGLGAAIAVYGDSDLTVTNTEINADGVANLAVFADNGASALLDQVTLHSDGGTLYENYINSPNQGTMVAPPWILGIMGTSRGTNLEGDDSTMTVVDSKVTASNWAILSTDAGSNMYLNVANTTMDLTGNEEPLQADGLYSVENPYTDRNGYGTYVIGNAVETFLGTTMNVGTYATIFTGGEAYYGNLKAGESYELKAADGSTHHTYTAEDDVQTVLNSDTFGFMAHQGDNVCTIDGAVVNSKFTGFVVKSGNNTTVNVENDAKITAENGILLQLFDNDDSTTAFNPNDELVGMSFGTTHEEYEGFPTEAIDPDAEPEGGMGMPGGAPEGEVPVEGEAPAEGSAPEEGASAEGGAPEGEASAEGGAPEEGAPGEGGPDGMGGQTGPNTSVYNIKDTALTGAIYNGIGWNANELSQGKVRQMFLEVNLSGTATLTGPIASTSCIHTTYEGQSYLKENQITAFDDETKAAEFAAEYQATSFSISEYFNICQVANLVKYNGLNDIQVTVADSAVWTVNDTSLIKSLTISGDGQVVVEEGVTLTVDGTAYEAGTYTAADFQ